MLDWLKKNKKFIASIVIVILQQVGIIPTLGADAPSADTSPPALTK
jgi:hypothetical protein